jgi:flagellum-specific peptidoglycan hydrolase FlgJ
MKKLILVILFSFITSFPSIGLKGEINEDLTPITYENLYEEIKKHGIKFPDVVFAQAILETGHFTSKLFKDANNLFGMKMPNRRETLAIGQRKNGYAIFTNWTSSVNDYLLWQEYVLRNKNITTKKQYLALLDKIYAENGNYVVHLNKVMLSHKEMLQ